jgi:hypothetical protein
LRLVLQVIAGFNFLVFSQEFQLGMAWQVSPNLWGLPTPHLSQQVKIRVDWVLIRVTPDILDVGLDSLKSALEIRNHTCY